MVGGQLSGDITAADIMAHDLSSLHLGTSDTILMKWTEGEVPRLAVAQTAIMFAPHSWHKSVLPWKRVGTVIRLCDMNHVLAGDKMVPLPSMDLPSPFADSPELLPSRP